tara:strand:- start:387 stop:1124 length:738 start_codon:yes stop_codon:yes gene_type:complete
MKLKLNLFFVNAIITGVLMSISEESYSHPNNNFQSFITQQYQTLTPLEGSKPSFDIYEKGIIGYYNLLSEGKSIDNSKLTLIDFRLSSNKKRMWVIDLKTNKVLYYRLVAHGKNTGEEYAKNFSNIKNSNKSSVGFYLTGENYYGKHGLSLRLDGMEPGFNDKARDRAIVMHSAAYVSKDFSKNIGRLGRSFGCPAIAMKDHKEIIKGLAERSLLFIYYPLDEYLAKTKLSNFQIAEEYFNQLNI